MNDLENIPTQWQAEDFFGSGVTTADFLTKLLSPVNMSDYNMNFVYESEDCSAADQEIWDNGLKDNMTEAMDKCAGLKTKCTSIFKMNG